MIRNMAPTDLARVMELSEAVGLFGETELVELKAAASKHLSAADASDERWFVDDEGGVNGVAYAMPERMTEGTWNLLYIAVHPDFQKGGRGKSLLQHIESDLAECNARVLIVETAGLESFDYVRSFYKSNGFREEARICDFYTDGMDKIVYWKRLSA